MSPIIPMNPEDYYVPPFNRKAPRTSKTNTAPLLLSSPSVTISANRTANADSAALSSPFRKPIFIDEIRWQIRMPSVEGDPLNMGGVIQTKLTLGRVIVTNGFVPIWNLGTVMQSGPFVEEQNDNAFGDENVGFSHYRWLLPKPLFVPTGTALISEFFRINDTLPGDAIVNVSYAGRYAPEGMQLPKKIDVPFAAIFLPPPAQVNSQSSELDLVNPFLVPVHAQRFIGRILDLTISNTAREVFSSEGPGDTIQVVMKDSYGNNVIRDFTPLSNAFDVTRRAWTFGKILRQKERYNVTVQGNTLARNISISMIGWRSETYR